MPKVKSLLIFFLTALITFGALSLVHAFTSRNPVNTLEGGFLQEPLVQNNKPTLVPSEYVLNTGVDINDIPPITNPVFTSVLAADAYLNDTTAGVSLLIDGEARFYPIQILNYHYVVEDKSASGAFALTYCPLCESAVVYATPKQLRASEYVYNNNVLLQDADGNLWNQLTGVAISGPEIGKTLPRGASTTISTWADWKRSYPEGRVLSQNTGFKREYGVHPFGAYPVNDVLYYPVNHRKEEIANKARIAGVNGLFAIPTTTKEKGGIAEISLENQSGVAFYGTNGAFGLFSPVIDGETLTFSYDLRKNVITDTKTGSIWSVDGRAQSGSLAGRQLEKIPYTRAFAACWFSMYPDSQLIAP